MRKGICLLLALVLCAVLVSPAFAVDFVPSITYKPTPDVHNATLVIPRPADATVPEGDPVEETEQEHVGGCIVVTSIIQAEEKTTDIAQEDRDLLLDVYAKLADGSMDLFVLPEASTATEPPATDANGETAEATQESTQSNIGLHYQDKNYVVIQLVDVSFKKSECVDEVSHVHKETLEREDVNIKVDFDLGVSPDTVVLTLHFHDGQWIPVTSTVNNGDGSVTCEFEHFCPVAFCIEAEEPEVPAQVDFSWLLWLILLLVCAGLVVFLVVYREKNKNKNTEE